MHYKSLFAALMVGALALASCVKNEESQSVTDLRKARADEIKSQAELNRANAEAAVTLAKAQETIAAAQAKLLEAQAAIAEAEAAKISVEAELAAVEVEIAKVKLEEERVKLQAKKAELEALKAKYEAEIAQYEAQKQQALDEMAKAEAEAELNELKLQRQLIQEQEALMKAIARLGKEKEKQINDIWTKYSNEVTALNAAQHQLLTKRVQLAKLQASIEPVSEIITEQIQDVMNEILAKEVYLETLKAQVLLSESELRAAIELAQAAYAEAKAEELTAAEEMKLAQEALSDKINKVLPYEEGWGDADSFVQWFENLNWDANGVYSFNYDGDPYSIFCKAIKLNEETGRYEMGVYFFFPSDTPNSTVQDNEFYPLYTCDITGDYAWHWTTAAITVPGFNYPYSVEGAEPKYQAWIQPLVYSPAKVYVENFNELLEYVAYYEQYQNEEQVQDLQDYYELAMDQINSEIETLNTVIAAFTEYVEEAEKEIKPAQIAVSLAKEQKVIAQAKADEAWDTYRYYSNSHDLSTAAYNEMYAVEALREATAALDKAQLAYDDAAIVLFGAVPNFAVTAEGDGDEGAVEGLIDKVARLEEEAYQAALITAEKQKAMEDAAKKVDPELEEAIVTAKANLKKQVDEVIAKEKAEEEALIAWHIAEIEYKADPTDDKKTAAEGKKKAWEDAVKATNTEKGKLPDLKKAVSDAQEAWDAVNDPYQAAVEAHKTAKTTSDKLYADWQTAKAALGNKDDAPSKTGSAYAVFKYAVNALETATANEKTARENLEKAHAANPDDTSELNKLYVAYYEANDAVIQANKAINEAKAELQKLYQGADAKYPNYAYRKQNIDPDYAENFSDELDYWLYLYVSWGASEVGESVPKDAFYMPGQLFAQYYWYQEQIDNVNTAFAKWFEKTNYAIYQQGIEELKAKLAVYAAEEDDYLNFIEEMQYLSDAEVAAKMAYYDAKNEAIVPATALNVLNELLTAKIYSSDGSDELAIAELEKKIQTAGKELKALEEKLIDLQAQLAYGIKDVDGKYAQAKIVELQNEIAVLMTEIEMRAALIEQYLEILDQLLDVEEVD